ncbi:hypothetical protein [Streptomyces sp. G1]|uniref:hypothetical protein n=1 Tax=Streptomyces sp. G1 TaxID=361572 RepID=UPI00202E57B5|nr:hypothetical protein [Streptomyces sp. G1]MCM1971334.1 hypothetical protein [Streptomyces sp. G1]
MFMATATLVAAREADAAKLESAVVTDIVWAAAMPADDLEHVHAKTASGRIELTFFHRTGNLADALTAAGEICRRALNSSPTLAQWRIAVTPQLPDAMPGSGTVLA